jgi:glycosyltransferase involved in cell wall biosynthesis
MKYPLLSQVKTFLGSWIASLKNFFLTQYRLRKVISLTPPGESKGNVLLAYLLKPFLLKPGEPFPNSHSNYWECWQMAQTFLALGYSVDVIWFKNRQFVPRKRYDYFIDVRYTMDAIAPLLNPDCIKILHADCAYIPFHNAAEAARLNDIASRRGITLNPKRFEPPTPAAAMADLITVLGNQFTIDTYAHTKKAIHRLKISVPEHYPWPVDKDFATCRSHFLWFGSWGLVHKGLDLVLEAFAAMPNVHLTVCGPIHQEPSFEQAYYKELYETPNIHTLGWVDTKSQQFLDLTKRCVGLVYPSCSEGGGSSVLTCMNASLIPIVSYESSVDIKDDYGILLKENTIANIQAAVQQIANLPPDQLQRMAESAWDFARLSHTRESFAESYRAFAQQLVASQPADPALADLLNQSFKSASPHNSSTPPLTAIRR